MLFASLKTFQISQSFDWYNSVLQVLIENYWTSIINESSDRNVGNTRLSKHVSLTLQSSLESRMLQIVPVFMVAMMIICVFVLPRRSNRKLSSVLLLCLHHVTSHSIVHVVTCSELWNTCENWNMENKINLNRKKGEINIWNFSHHKIKSSLRYQRHVLWCLHWEVVSSKSACLLDIRGQKGHS